jgi:molybdopterin synthase catalytic subunit
VSSHLTDLPLDLGALLGELASPERGAQVVFVGTVRDHHGGRGVVAIEYSAYRPLAEKVLTSIEAELAAAHPGLQLRIVHRLGRLAAGDASVAILTAAPHRAAAYDANRRALERVKAEAPIWKHEHYREGDSRWREEEPLQVR